MNKERYNQIIDEAYENYLKNFIEPTCPPNLDVQPTYYEPMTKDWFVKSAKERGSRGYEFSERWGLKIEERKLILEERRKLANYESEFVSPMTVESWDRNNIPTKLITIIYKGEKIEVYE